MNPTVYITLGYLLVLAVAVFLCQRFLRPYHNRAIICLTAVLLSALVVTRAGYKTAHGEAGGYRLGVDLVGGTILVYEVDEAKLKEQEEASRGAKKFDPTEMAAFLKRRIDPADLYNVTIRPVGQTRFEIILPTGGTGQARLGEEAWSALLAKVRDPEQWKAYFDAAEQRITNPDEKTRYHSSIQITLKYLPALANAKLETVPQGRVRDLILRVRQELDWAALKDKLREKFPEAKKADLDAVPVGQKQKMVDALVAAGVKAEDARKFVDENEQTIPTADIARFINDSYEGSGQRGASAEFIQEVKDKIAQQGSLEFRIVANEDQDGPAIRAAQEALRDRSPERVADMERRASQGLPPPPPVRPAEAAEEWMSTYSWVELGRDERRSLGLNNDAGRNPDPKSHWAQVAAGRDKGEAVLLTINDVQSVDKTKTGLTTMLVYSRKTENRQLSAVERDEKKFDYFVLLRNPNPPSNALTGLYLTDASVNDQSGDKAVNFSFNARGGQLFYELTSANLPRGESPNCRFSYLAIILDNEVVSAPSLSVPISDRGQITFGRNANPDDLRRLAQILRSGALPATLKPQPVSENTMGSTLGPDTIRKGMWSVGGAFAAVLVFMVVYYRFAGLVASVALLANLLLTVAFMSFVNATFTLPGLAGLVLTLGMAVDANVLIYERLREERERGASLTLALRNGYDRAFPTILDTHLTSIFTAIVLYAFGNDQLKGFGVSLTSGLVISLFTSLYMTRLMFDLWQAKGWLRKLSMYQGLTNFIHRNYIDFMRIRYYWFTATVVLTVIGLAVFLIRGPAGLNIDFVGGTAYGGRLTDPVDIETLRAKMAPKWQEKRLEVKDVKEDNPQGTQFTITYADGPPQVVPFRNPVEGATEQEKVAAVKARARDLPDVSVVQTFVHGEDNTGNKSRYFTIRTTEKEPDLVQVMVNRLLVDDSGKPLQQAVALEKFDVKGTRANLQFSRPASPGYLKLLLGQGFKAQGFETPPTVDLQGDGPEEEGQYRTMDLDLAGNAEAAAKLPAVLKSAQQSLAARPLPERLENFDAQLAADTSRSAMYAILASWAAILLFLWFRFGNWTFGAAAVLCLIHDLCFTLGCIAFCHYLVDWAPWLANVFGIEDFKIDLTAVAALLTLIGYSVSDTIVVFDRIREVRGKNPLLTPQMINDSVNQTLSRTLLASLTVFLVVLVLYVWGGEGVHLFAFVMVIGVIVGTYSSIYIASPLLLMFGEGTPKASGRQPAAVTAGATA
jgi:SecD/SecF fusion protein